jgi:hypothetical protein
VNLEELAVASQYNTNNYTNNYNKDQSLSYYDEVINKYLFSGINLANNYKKNIDKSVNLNESRISQIDRDLDLLMNKKEKMKEANSKLKKDLRIKEKELDNLEKYKVKNFYIKIN